MEQLSFFSNLCPLQITCKLISVSPSHISSSSLWNPSPGTIPLTDFFDMDCYWSSRDLWARAVGKPGESLTSIALEMAAKSTDLGGQGKEKSPMTSKGSGRIYE